MQSHSFLNSQTILVFPYFICFLFINKLLCYQLTLTLTTEISVLVAGGGLLVLVPFLPDEELLF